MESIANINENCFPVTVFFPKKISKENFASWYFSHKDDLDNKLLEAGAILFKGIDIREVNDFEEILDKISTKFMDYVDGNSPRTKLTSKVYTSTEYDADFAITLHNELSYANRWPAKLFFCCLVPATSGGETPIADCRKILGRMRPDLVQVLERKGVRYIRNIHGGGGFSGPSWQETFETNDKRKVEEHCNQHQIEYTWKEDGGLRLVQHRPAIVEHPVTQEKVWFNQADQFHPVHLEEDVYDTLMLMYDNQEEDLPTYVTYGDGSRIENSVIEEIRTTVDAEAVLTQWEKGDLLVVDNVLVAHGRMPYKGARKILVAMA